jgi:pimeloyl-ACP methyl ester carboxylesterase
VVSPARRFWRRASRVLLLVVTALALLIVVNVRTDRSLSSLLAKYGGGASRFITLDGVLVHYRDEGAGSPLVLIHGTSSSLHTWDDWVARLREHRRIVRLDLPGFGLTGPAPDRDYSAARYSHLVAALLARLGIDRADIAGNSLGGRVAMTLALEYPERVRRLVLVDAAGLSGQEPPRIFRIARTPVLNALLRWVTPRTLVRKNVAEVYGDPSRLTDALVDRYYDLLRREGNRGALLDRLNGPADPDLDGRVAEIRAPVLVEWGEKDRWIPVAFAHRLSGAIPGARLVTYAAAGHVPMEELPDATAADAEAFLAGDSE